MRIAAMVKIGQRCRFLLPLEKRQLRKVFQHNADVNFKHLNCVPVAKDRVPWTGSKLIRMSKIIIIFIFISIISIFSLNLYYFVMYIKNLVILNMQDIAIGSHYFNKHNISNRNLLRCWHFRKTTANNAMDKNPGIYSSVEIYRDYVHQNVGSCFAHSQEWIRWIGLLQLILSVTVASLIISCNQ